MNNDKKTISANEINKYTYCPYQWYYERFYGRAYIRREYKERNARHNLEDSITSNFNKGAGFHKRYLLINRVKCILKIAVILIAVCVILYLTGYFRGL